MKRTNCFDLLRIFASLMVMHSHHFGMNHLTAPFLRGWYSYGIVAVMMFFSISGFLVTQSFARSVGFMDFMIKRIRRVFPGLIFCSFILVYFVAPFYQQDVQQYLFMPDTFKNFIMISALHAKDIPHIFSGYSQQLTANAVLWTLPIEVMLYIVIGFSLAMKNSWKVPAISLFFCIVCLALFTQQIKPMVYYTVPIFWLLSFGICFYTGSLLAACEKSWTHKNTKMFLFGLSIIMIYILKDLKDLDTIGFIAISLITIIIGTSFKDKLINGRFDISYGLYIWSWPVQAIIVNQTELPFWGSFIVSVMAASIIAMFSWKFIEKPFLAKKKTISAVN